MPDLRYIPRKVYIEFTLDLDYPDAINILSSHVIKDVVLQSNDGCTALEAIGSNIHIDVKRKKFTIEAITKWEQIDRNEDIRLTRIRIYINHIGWFEFQVKDVSF